MRMCRQSRKSRNPLHTGKGEVREAGGKEVTDWAVAVKGVVPGAV